MGSNITGLSYDFEDEAFEHISEDAMDFIHKLLVKDQRKRLKALECLKHPWLDQRQAADKSSFKEINTDKLKSFLMRRRWQKAAHAIRALGRFTSLGFRADTKDSASSITALSTQSADFYPIIIIIIVVVDILFLLTCRDDRVIHDATNTTVKSTYPVRYLLLLCKFMQIYI